MLLLKIEFKKQYNLILTIAFWCIYKLILERNKSGNDKRSCALKNLFVREINMRIEIQFDKKQRGVINKNEQLLPKELLNF